MRGCTQQGTCSTKAFWDPAGEHGSPLTPAGERSESHIWVLELFQIPWQEGYRDLGKGMPLTKEGSLN